MNPKLPSQEQNPYWTFQIAGWSIFFVASIFSGLVLYDFGWKIVLYWFYISVVGFVITHLYRNYIKWRDWHKLPIRKLTFRILFLPIALGIIWEALTIPIPQFLFDFAGVNGQLLTAALISYSLILFIWNLIYFFYKLITSYKQSEVEKWRLRAAVKDAQLIALKSQINPHFIFNSLNNIRSLVIENPEKARDMITHLSGLLRYSVQFSNKEYVTVESEIEIVRNYLNLESIQFEDRLRFNFSLEPEALQQRIPPMAIQLLVENAVKHGISKLPKGGEVDVQCRIENDHLVVNVINTGILAEKDPKDSGIGLKNATERLKLLFGNTADLQLQSQNDSTVKASFIVPLKSKDYESNSRRRLQVST